MWADTYHSGIAAAFFLFLFEVVEESDTSDGRELTSAFSPSSSGVGIVVFGSILQVSDRSIFI